MQHNKILIIDDDQLLVHSIKKSLMLEDNAYEIISAGNGKEGLELYHKEKPVLVLLDLHMPVMGGVEFLEEIDLSPSGPSGVIVVTTSSDDEDIKTCIDLGVSSFIEKPFDRHEFIAQIKHVIAFKKLQQDLNEKSESQASTCQCSSVPQQGYQHSSQTFAEGDKNVSAHIVGIECPLHFTSF